LQSGFWIYLYTPFQSFLFSFFWGKVWQNVTLIPKIGKNFALFLFIKELSNFTQKIFFFFLGEFRHLLATILEVQSKGMPPSDIFEGKFCILGNIEEIT